MLRIPIPKSPGPAPLPPLPVPELFKLPPEEFADAVFGRASQVNNLKPGLQKRLREFRSEYPKDITDVRQLSALHIGTRRILDAFVIEPGIQMPWGIVVQP